MIKRQCESEVKLPTRQFGFLFSLLFILAAIFPNSYDSNFRALAFVASLLSITIALFWPRLLVWPTRVFLKFGKIMNRIFFPMVLAIIYFGVITPIGYFARRKQYLAIDLDMAPHWNRKTSKPIDMTKQY